MAIHCETEHTEIKNTLFTALRNSLDSFINKIIQKSELREALKELSSLDDSILKDIGITRDDIAWVHNQPNNTPPSSELQCFLKKKKACR